MVAWCSHGGGCVRSFQTIWVIWVFSALAGCAVTHNHSTTIFVSTTLPQAPGETSGRAPSETRAQPGEAHHSDDPPAAAQPPTARAGQPWISRIFEAVVVEVIATATIAMFCLLIPFALVKSTQQWFAKLPAKLLQRPRNRANKPVAPCFTYSYSGEDIPYRRTAIAA